MIVTLHGFTGDPTQWAGVVSAVHVALLGHSAETRADGSETFALEVERTAAMIAPGTHLAGYSMGARLALAVALASPDKIDRLTLVGAHPGLRRESERNQRRAADQRWIDRLSRYDIDTFVRNWEQQPLWASQKNLPAADQARQRTARSRHDPLQLALALRCLGLGEQPSFWDELSRLTMPVCLMAGEYDLKFRGLCLQMAEKIRRPNVVIAPACGHNPLLENPAFVAEQLAAAPK